MNAPTDIAALADTLNANERAALAALPLPDAGYLDDENWWLFYTLLDHGLLRGEGYTMLRTDLGDAVLTHIRSNATE